LTNPEGLDHLLLEVWDGGLDHLLLEVWDGDCPI
jgi:hypothetical protein